MTKDNSGANGDGASADIHSVLNGNGGGVGKSVGGVGKRFARIIGIACAIAVQVRATLDWISSGKPFATRQNSIDAENDV